MCALENSGVSFVLGVRCVASQEHTLGDVALEFVRCLGLVFDEFVAFQQVVELVSVHLLHHHTFLHFITGFTLHTFSRRHYELYTLHRQIASGVAFDGFVGVSTSSTFTSL